MTALLALGLSSGFAFAGLAPPTEPPALRERIDGLLDSIAGKDLPGAAVVVLKDGAVVHSRAYGIASIELGEQLPGRRQVTVRDRTQRREPLGHRLVVRREQPRPGPVDGRPAQGWMTVIV
jgi:hypothetical protein